MLISELSQKTGTNLHTIRYYEKLDLINASSRRDNNYREYNEDTIYLLRFIDTLKTLGFTLRQIKNIIYVFHTDTANALSHAHEMLETKRTELDIRISRDESMRAKVIGLLDQCGIKTHNKEVTIRDLVESLHNEHASSCPA